MQILMVLNFREIRTHIHDLGYVEYVPFKLKEMKIQQALRN